MDKVIAMSLVYSFFGDTVEITSSLTAVNRFRFCLFRLIALPNGHIVSTQIVLIIGLPKLTILLINR